MKKITRLLSVAGILFSSFLQLANAQDIHPKVDSLMLSGDFESAEELAIAANEENPGDPRILCALACVYRNMAYEEILELNTLDYMRIEESKGEIGLTEDNFKDVIKSSFHYEDSIFSKAEEIYFQIIEIDPHYKDAYMNLINSYENDNEFDQYYKAVELYARINRENEDTKYVLLDLASKLYNKSKTDEAERMYKYTIEMYPSFSEAISDLGAVYVAQGKLNEAKIQFEDAINLTPDDTLVIQNLINVNIILGSYHNAYNESQKLAAITSSNFNNFTAGCLAMLVNNSDPDNYLDTFIQLRKKKTGLSLRDDFWQYGASVLKDTPEDSAALKYLIYELYSGGYHFDMIVFSELFSKIAPDDPGIMQLMASTYEKFDHTEKVLQLLKRIEKLNKNEEIMPENNLLFNFGRNYFVAGDYNKSIEYMMRINDEKLRVVTDYLIGESYYYMGDLASSLKYHKQNENRNDNENMYYINMSLRRISELER